MAEKSKILSKIGERLKQLRIDNNCGSYEKFAFDNDLSRATIYRIEAGKLDFRIETLIKILDAHNITLKDFFESIN